jgi:multidrug efflux system membrane fusion protein
MQDNIPNESSIEEYLDSKPTKWVSLIFFVLTLLAVIGFFASRGMTKSNKSDKSAGKDRATPVTVAIAFQKTVPVQLQAIGNVQAWSTVSITPQVSGQITGVYFKKGQQVHKGQLLFALDNRTEFAAIQQAQGVLDRDIAQVQQARATLAKDLHTVDQAKTTLGKDQAQVQQAKSTLAKDQALAKYARAQSKRYGRLYKDGAISLDQAEQYFTNDGSDKATLQVDVNAIKNAQEVVKGDIVAIKVDQSVVLGDQAAIKNAQAVVKSDQAALASAQVQMSYTKIYAPITGLAGNILITEGNVVQANSATSNPLVTIAQIHPIQVSFSIPESQLPAVQQYMENGKLKVSVVFGSNNTHPISGVLAFVNNTVDNTTGTIQLLGNFDNSEGRLFPGRYVDTTLTLTRVPNATVVPAQAVENGPNGQFVFVVQPDRTVENVPVKVSNTVDNLAVIAQGIQPGQQVVTDGQANLNPGSKIRIKTAADLAIDGTQTKGKHHHHSHQSSGDNS